MGEFHIVRKYERDRIKAEEKAKLKKEKEIEKNKLKLEIKKEKEKLKYDKFIKRMSDTFGEEYSVLGKFVNLSTKCLIQHNICGYIWTPFPSNLFSGQSKCPNCSGKAPLTTESFKKLVHEISNGEYAATGVYKNNYTKVDIKHLVCGYEWGITLHCFKYMERRCPRCANRERYTTEDFKNLLCDKTNGEYELLDEYINNYTKIKFRHITCGNIFEESPANLIYSNVGCPDCYSSMSKGEVKIFEYLTNRGINFKPQYTFDDCRNERMLKFDFAILNKFNKLLCLIEFDGKQHYEPIDYFGGEENLKYTQNNDNIKNIYCKDNNILLLRIPYWEEKNIDEIIESYISKII